MLTICILALNQLAMKNIFILTLAALSFGFGKPASADYKMSFSSYHHGQMQSNIWRLNQNKLEVVYCEWGAKEQINSIFHNC